MVKYNIISKVSMLLINPKMKNSVSLDLNTSKYPDLALSVSEDLKRIENENKKIDNEYAEKNRYMKFDKSYLFDTGSSNDLIKYFEFIYKVYVPFKVYDTSEAIFFIIEKKYFKKFISYYNKYYDFVELVNREDIPWVEDNQNKEHNGVIKFGYRKH